jgi:hypothetical protein
MVVFVAIRDGSLPVRWKYARCTAIGSELHYAMLLSTHLVFFFEYCGRISLFRALLEEVIRFARYTNGGGPTERPRYRSIVIDHNICDCAEKVGSGH